MKDYQNKRINLEEHGDAPCGTCIMIVIIPEIILEENQSFEIIINGPLSHEVVAINISCTISQSAYQASQLPSSLFGLGCTNNYQYVDLLFAESMRNQ
ncbi:16563_t:CDS:2, partial [Gigaspora rosea]